MRLAVCPDCRIQYDITAFQGSTLECSCGSTVPTEGLVGRDAEIHRCGSCGAGLGENPERCEFCGSAVVVDSTRLSLVCPECYARNDESSGFCTSCGVKFEPMPIPGKDTTLPCPCCNEEMVWRSVGGIALQECPQCNGLWVSGDTFDTLIQKAVESRRARPSAAMGINTAKTVTRSRTVKYRKCPACGGAMQRKNFGRRSGVIVDWCGRDGTWMDADELEAIAEYVTAGGLEQAAGAETTDWRMTSNPDRVRALYESEKLMAVERREQRKRQERLTGGEPQGPTLAGLLSWLLD